MSTTCDLHEPLKFAGGALNAIRRTMFFDEPICSQGHRFIVHRTLPAADDRGFDISLASARGMWIVTLGGWDGEFDQLAPALKLVSDAREGVVRIKVDSVAGRPVRWTIERFAPAYNSWRVIAQTGVMQWLLGRTPLMRIYTNNDYLEGVSTNGVNHVS
jgi:hypothetical protein